MPPRMRVADFMALVQERTLALLPDDLREACHPRVRFVWFQVHFHTPKVHYEVWLTRKTGRIEIGLHFEGPREFSYAWAALIAEHMPEIQARLGSYYELEEWTSSWARLHETIPYDPPSEALAEDIAQRFAGLIAVCQPIVGRLRDHLPAELESEPARTKTGRGRFHSRRRTRA